MVEWDNLNGADCHYGLSLDERLIIEAYTADISMQRGAQGQGRQIGAVRTDLG